VKLVRRPPIRRVSYS